VADRLRAAAGYSKLQAERLGATDLTDPAALSTWPTI
jgi:hypothetical protein